jgi:serine/threonine protein kinase/CRP-like cAMP-binding protein
LQVVETQILQKNKDVGATMIDALKDIPILGSLSETERRKLSKSLKQKQFNKNDYLMKQGENGSEFYIIVSGACKVLINKENSDEQVEVAQLTDGDYCGEQALLQDCTRGATIQCTEDTQCLILEQNAFKQFIQENNIQFAKRDAKRNAISAELMDNFKSDNAEDDGAKDKEKSDEVKAWLLKCVSTNILFSNLDEPQRKVVIEQMYKVSVKKDEFLIEQGTEGNTFYVVNEGEFIITVKDVGQVDTLDKGRCVGELALLYNAPRAASVQCISENGAVVWAVDRSAFRKALMDVHQQSTNQNLEFLKKCELLRPLLTNELQLIDQALEPMDFKKGETIFKIDEEGDRFYLIKSGTVEGTAKKDNSKFTLTAGAFFGERALLTNEGRAATIVATTDVACLTLSREEFNLLLGPLDDIMKRNLEEYEKPPEERQPLGQAKENEAEICGLKEFTTIGILGRGAFGTVKLVVDPGTKKSYALKAIRKNQVVELGQQAHILNEKKVMIMLNNRFLVNLKKTFKDEFKVYFLLEVCLGGELFTILRKMRSFDEPTAKFYAACVVEAFNYMHERDVIYRDLKPENLVLTDQGYIKVTDFGFAKIVPNKTFTLCGTPDYLAPEIVTGQGHGKGVDWWTTGILIYEMLASFPPFFDDEPMMTYRKIIQGKFKFPRYLSPESKDLISKFLKSKPTKRLGIIKGGAELIRTHPWFKEFDWDSLRKGELKPPIRPKVKSPSDLSNFDHFQEKDEDLSYRGDPDLGWDKDF